MKNKPLLGGFEAGGTKFNCVIGYGDGHTVAQESIPTTSPVETFGRVKHFFETQSKTYGGLEALGIAHFGPIELNKASEDYGKILSTPKPGWSGFDVVSYFSNLMNIPIALQTDVNGSVVGEYHFGAAKGIENFVYVTVGTGIGAGIFSNGQLLYGVSHPEVGHMIVGQNLAQDAYEGCCPFHGNCLEGLASGPAINARWGELGQSLPIDHPAWDLEASYLSMLCVNLSHFYSPERIVFAGGVMKQKQIFPIVRQKFQQFMNGYGASKLTSSVESYIVPSPLAGKSAEKGVLVMAQKALEGNP